jgi:hypothetical protein
VRRATLERDRVEVSKTRAVYHGRFDAYAWEPLECRKNKTLRQAGAFCSSRDVFFESERYAVTATGFGMLFTVFRMRETIW